MEKTTSALLEEYLVQQHSHVELPLLKGWRVTKKLFLFLVIIFIAAVGWALYYGWNISEGESMTWVEIMTGMGPVVFIGMLMTYPLNHLKHKYHYGDKALKQRAAQLSYAKKVLAVAIRLMDQLSSIVTETSAQIERRHKMLEFTDNHQQLLEIPEVQNLVWTSLYGLAEHVETRGVRIQTQGKDDREFGVWLQKQYSPTEAT